MHMPAADCTLLTLEQPVIGDDDEGVHSSFKCRHSHGSLQSGTQQPTAHVFSMLQ
jgi:hypothetical protein